MTTLPPRQALSSKSAPVPAGAAELSVYNVTGQRVMAQTFVAGRSGNVNLDLRHLSNGVYL